MKTIYKSILFVAIAGIMGLLTVSCNESEDAPYISYVRISDPAVKDSLLVEASQGQLVVIVGGNLQNTREVWFNDQKASLSPYYVTANSVMVYVPSTVPVTITNQIKLVFSNGNTLSHDFQVKISKPVIDYMDCEYVLEGKTAVINGTYLYLPITVTFPGGATASSVEGNVKVNEENTILTVRVPEGATIPGQLTVTSNFGTTKSNFLFLDDRNIFQDFEDAGWWAGSQITNPGIGDPPLINGAYRRLTQTIGGWAWTEVFSWWINHNIPDDAIVNPNKYNYKFEVNTLKPYNSNGIRIWVTSSASNTSGKYFEWNGTSGVDTKGEWHTMIFPFEDIMAANETIGVLTEYFYGFIFCGNGTLECDMCFDNFRIVPKVIN